MTLKIGTTRDGRLRSQKGFSMIELMVTVVFVAMGSLVIQGSFLRSADMFGRYSNTLKIMGWMNEQCSKAKEALLYSDESPGGSESGEIVLSGRSFSWTREIELLDAPNLNAIRTSARWTEGGKPMELKNELYVYKKDPSFGS